MTASARYYGDSAVMRTPPPDLPSLLLKERIVYLGLPLFSDDDAKRQLGMDVTELIIAQLLFLEFDNSEKPIYFYINSNKDNYLTVTLEMINKSIYNDSKHSQIINKGIEKIINKRPIDYSWEYKRFKKSKSDQQDPYSGI